MHRGQLVVTDNIAAFDVVVFLHTLMRHVAEKDNAVSCLRMDDHVPLNFTPFLEQRSVERLHVLGLEGVPALDELEVGDAEGVVLEVEGGVDADGETASRYFSARRFSCQ